MIQYVLMQMFGKILLKPVPFFALIAILVFTLYVSYELSLLVPPDAPSYSAPATVWRNKPRSSRTPLTVTSSTTRGVTLPGITDATSSITLGTIPLSLPLLGTSQTVNAPTQSSTATSVPHTTSPALNYKYGVSLGTTLLGKSDAEINTILDDLVALKIGWIRMDFDWSAIQYRSAASYDYANYDRIIKLINARGIKVLGIIHFSPSWGRPSWCTSMRCGPASAAQYATFSKELAKHYSPLGVHHWEIWNEPNLWSFWRPEADPAAYTQLLKEAYPAIKAADSNAIVITGGLSPAATGGGDIAPREFLEKMYANGAKGYFDAVGMHPYSYPVPPTYVADWNAWQQMASAKTNLRAIMTANGDGAKQIWMTEFGAPTGGPGGLASVANYNFRASPDHVTEDLQSKILTEAITETKKNAWAGPLFIYSYKDLGTSQSSIENFFGFIRADGTKKPAYTAIKTLLAE